MKEFISKIDLVAVLAVLSLIIIATLFIYGLHLSHLDSVMKHELEMKRIEVINK